MAFDRQSREWLFGDEAQQRWARILAERGNAVLPTYGMIGNGERTKAPLLFVEGGVLVCPDALCLSPKAGNQWHEVKAKSQPSFSRNRRRWEHGADWMLAKEYEEVERQSGTPVWLIVYEERSPVDPGRESAVAVSGKWLGIRLTDAMRLGERRPLWPGGKGDPRNRGRDGMGGLLWPRSPMIDLLAAKPTASRPGQQVALFGDR